MTTKDIKELIKLVNELDLAEVKIVNKEFELKIRTAKDVKVQAVSAAAPMMPAAIAPQQVVSAAAPAPAAQASADTPSAGDAGENATI